MKRRGVTQEQAQRALISNPTVIGAIMVQRGEADAMIAVRWAIIMNILAW